jgi:pyruvate dehydrogenase E1 component alpha subunit
LTADYKGEDKVALAFFGDGAVAQGQVHEGINLAATWDLPAIFVVENNGFGEATPMEQQHNVEHLSATAEAYDIPGFTVDGMDVTAVYEAVKEARERAANGEGPTFIEANTYRYEGHFEGDHQPYRTEEDIQLWKDRDAIETFKDRLVDAGVITQEEFDEMRDEIEAEIDDHAERAKDADYPDPSEAYEDMFGATVPEINDFAARMRADGGER